jgi:hemerythrin-like metal-binding protein
MTPRELLDEVARDHSEIAELVRSLRGAIEAEDHSRVKSLLVRLQAVEMRHYATEDGLMRALDYADAGPHQAQHASMIDTLARINQALTLDAPATVSVKVVAHLEEALAHMAGADEKLHRFALGRVQAQNS